MANTFYDLLEVSQSASHETIAAAYRRLHAKHAENVGAGNEDATNLLIALREAYGTLSDPERRRRYDGKLAVRSAEPAMPASRPRSFLVLLALVAVIAISGSLYKKYQAEQEAARLERERIAAEAKAAELALKKQREEALAADDAERERFRNEAIERFNRERDIAYGNQVSRNLQYAEQQAKRDEQREAQKRVLAERQQQHEAERQLARDKAYLRQLESENGRPRTAWILSR